MAPAASTAGDAGQIYVVLVDTTDGLSKFSAIVTDDAGVFRYDFPAVFEVEYTMFAGSDFDHDFFICDAGEACGLYLEYAAPTLMTIIEDTVLEAFPVSYDWYLPEAPASAAESPKLEAIPR